jgi:integrase
VRGTLRQRGNSWECIVFLGRDPVTGKKRYRSQSIRGSKSDAELALAALLVEVGTTPISSTATVGELLERWFEQAAPDFSPSTALETRRVIDRYLTPAFGTTSLRRLRTADIDAFYRGLRTSGSTGQPLKPSTVRRIHGILHRALGQGVKWGWLSRNPASAASPPRVPKRDIAPPAPADVARLFTLAEQHDPALAAFVMLAAASGARRSELVALRWTDVDFERRQLHVRRGVVRGPDGLVEKDTKTHAARVIALDDRTASVLGTHLERAQQLASELGVALAPDAFVFASDGVGRVPTQPDSMTRAFARLCRRAGVAGVRLHDLRHYVATRLLGAGVDVRTVAGRLGHRNASTTLNVYSHFLPESDRHAAETLAALLSPG